MMEVWKSLVTEKTSNEADQPNPRAERRRNRPNPVLNANDRLL